MTDRYKKVLTWEREGVSKKEKNGDVIYGRPQATVLHSFQLVCALHIVWLEKHQL